MSYSRTAGGVIQTQNTTKSANYNLSQDDYFVMVNTAGGSFTLTLPTITANIIGQIFRIKDLGGDCFYYPVTIARGGADVIDGGFVSTTLAADFGMIGLYAQALGQWAIVEYFDPTRYLVNEYDELVAATKFTSLNNGTGAAIADTPSPNNTIIGLETYSTGTTTTGRSGRGFSDFDQFLGVNRFITQANFNAPVLSDVTETYAIKLGLYQSLNTAGGTDYVGFRYEYNVNGGRFQGESAAASVAATPLDTGIALNTADYFTLLLDINAAANRVRFKVNGAHVGQIVTNIPTAVALRFGFFILKSAGTTARLINANNLYACVRA
jgi:hypothetical protein